MRSPHPALRAAAWALATSLLITHTPAAHAQRAGAVVIEGGIDSTLRRGVELQLLPPTDNLVVNGSAQFDGLDGWEIMANGSTAGVEGRTATIWWVAASSCRFRRAVVGKPLT